MDYYVLATNYEEYALVYTCQNIEGGNRRGNPKDKLSTVYALFHAMKHRLTKSLFLVGSWQLSRTGSLTPDAQTAMNTIIHSSDVVDLFEGFYQPTKQDPDSCYNYPDFDKTWEYVELPGKCDDRIKGVENFDLNRVSFFFLITILLFIR